MKAWIISDLHITHQDLANPSFLKIPEADICICNGDTAGFIELSIEFLAKRIAPFMPVVSTLGNHDYYGGNISQTLAAAYAAAQGTALYFLENDCFEIGDLRIVGATLWTDYEIPWGSDGEEMRLPERRDFAIDFCRQYMRDFSAMGSSEAFANGNLRQLTSWELLVRHQESRAFIKAALATPYHGTTIVLTHHAPSPRSLHPKFIGHPSNAGFASDLTDLIHARNPDLWVHGHVHHFLDYIEGTTRIVCNPRGYRNEWEATGFQPNLVIDI
jgi:predicted phosphohydrolase